jgi:hypothetical protein
MNAEVFVEKVRRMREKQKTYFKNRLSKDLIASKQLETEVDKALEQGIEFPVAGHLEVTSEDTQPTLFGE